MKKLILSFFLPLILLLFNSEATPISASMKSKHSYSFIHNHIRTLQIAINNFGNNEQKKKYNDIKILFQKGAEEHFSRNFDSSLQKFYQVKETLYKLMEEFALLYFKRAKEILDSTSKTSFDIITKYASKNGKKNNMKRPYNPVEDNKGYSEDEYHFCFDRETIKSYLDSGYRKLEESKKILSDRNIEILKNKKNKTQANIEYIVNGYAKIILFCRHAKLYGIEIYKLININKLGDIIKKYNLDKTTTRLDPIFDDRIPEKYKVDANDNQKLNHEIEKKKLEKEKTNLDKKRKEY